MPKIRSHHKKCRTVKPRCPYCAKNHSNEECCRKKVTICANCGSHEHGAAFSGCPVSVKYYNEIQNNNNIIKKEHRERIWLTNKKLIKKLVKNAQKRLTKLTSKTKIQNKPRKKQQPIKKKKTEQNITKNQTNQIDLDKLKQEIMLMTTQFVLNKIGQSGVKKQNKNEIQKEIENFLKDFNNTETPKHDSNTNE